jgi:hypothetical protein
VKDVPGQTPFERTDITIETQFGPSQVTALRAEALCVPAAKDLVPLAAPFDRFKCYRLRNQKRTPRFVPRAAVVSDQFETKDMTVKRPFMICNPVDKDGEPIQNPVCHLTCYKIADVRGQTGFQQQEAIIEDEFGTANVGTNANVKEFCRKSAVLCVPSLKVHD